MTQILQLLMSLRSLLDMSSITGMEPQEALYKREAEFSHFLLYTVLSLFSAAVFNYTNVESLAIASICSAGASLYKVWMAFDDITRLNSQKGKQNAKGSKKTS